MTGEDAEKLKGPSVRWKPDLRCASCGQSPTCPMLVDEVWLEAWGKWGVAVRNGAMPIRELTCTNQFWCGLNAVKHSKRCEITRGEPRQLLCMECAEKALGRELELRDLYACVGNVPLWIMVRRARRESFIAGIEQEIDVAGKPGDTWGEQVEYAADEHIGVKRS